MNAEEQYSTLEQAIQPYKALIEVTSDTIVDQDVSNYPIFIIHEQGINVGIPLDTNHIPGPLLINASSLEEFVTKQLVQATKVDDFKAVYKDQKAFLCLFVVTNSGANFIFIPRN